MEKTILEGNKLIALFMGFTEDQIQAEDWCGCNVLAECPFTGEKSMVAAAYDSSWSWLMPVVEKIESQWDRYVEIHTHRIEIVGTECTVSTMGLFENREEGYLYYCKDAPTKIEAVWDVVIEYIQWYNTTQPNLSAAPTAQPQAD